MVPYSVIGFGMGGRYTKMVAVDWGIWNWVVSQPERCKISKISMCSYFEVRFNFQVKVQWKAQDLFLDWWNLLVIDCRLEFRILISRLVNIEASDTWKAIVLWIEPPPELVSYCDQRCLTRTMWLPEKHKTSELKLVKNRGPEEKIGVQKKK